MSSHKPLETMLGLSSSWRIRDVVAHAEQQQMSVYIERAPTGLLQGMFRSRQDVREFRWNDLPIGSFQTVIHLSVSTQDKLRPEPWMMRSGTPMSERLVGRIDKTATLSVQGRTREMLSEVFKVNLSTFKLPRVADTAPKADALAAKTAAAPTIEVPPRHSIVWHYLIREQIAIELKSLPLKLLLARLRLRSKLEQIDLAELTGELHRFFAERAPSHVYELMQLNQRLAAAEREQGVAA